jgi:hypothetical protein
MMDMMERMVAGVSLAHTTTETAGKGDGVEEQEEKANWNSGP